MFDELYQRQGALNVSAGTRSNDITNVVFSNANGVSFGLSGSTVTATVKTNYQSSGAYLTTAMASNAATISNIKVSAGASSANLSALTFSNSNGVSFGLSGSTITASVDAGTGGGGSAGTVSGFEPFPLYGAATANSIPEIGSWNFWPIVIPGNIYSGRINMFVSHDDTNGAVGRLSTGSSFASNTTGTLSHRYLLGRSIALYSRGAGANNTQLESFWSNAWTLQLDESVSVALTNATHVTAGASYTLSYICSVGSDGAYTTTTLSTQAARSSASVSMATSAFTASLATVLNLLTGKLNIPYGFNTSVPMGQYWLAVGYSTSRTSLGSSLPDIIPLVNHFGMNAVSTDQHRLFGNTATTGRTMYMPGWGLYTAASGVPPITVQFTEIKQTSAQFYPYLNFINLPADPKQT